MNAFDYFILAFQKYADFSGRARRAEFWYFYLFHMLAIMVLSSIGGFFGSALGEMIGAIPLIAYFFISIIPILALVVRRLHDTNRSGWWYFIGAIPIIGVIILLIFLVTEGTHGPNRYGEDPKEEEELFAEDQF